jgi:hypothetical protein
MTDEPQLPVPVPAEPVPVVHILDIEDPAIGLMTQFIIAAMLHEGISELRLPKELLGQAMHKKVWAIDEGEHFSFGIHR